MLMKIKRPVLWALFFLVIGIIAGGEFAVPAFFIGLLFCVVLYRFSKYSPVIFFGVMLLVGIIRVGGSLTPVISEPADVALSGIVLNTGLTSGGNTWAVVRTAHPVTYETIRVMAYLRPHQARVAIGTEIAIQGELRPLGRAVNPWGYDQFMHLRRQKIDGVIRPDSVRTGGRVTSLRTVLSDFQSRLSEVFDHVLPPNDAAIMKGMILGIRQDISQGTSELYRVMGIYHIISISGLHITVLLLAVNKLLGLVMNQRRGMVLALVVMSLYCLMTGAEAATVRAVLMGGVLIFGKILFRERDNLASISIAAIVLLVYEPLFLYNAGFQLSFGAMYGMGVLTHPVERLFYKLGVLRRERFRGLRSDISAGIAALVSTYIVAAYHFYEIPLYGVIGNLLIMPVSTVLLVFGIIGAVAGLIWMPVAHLLMGTVYFILRFIEICGRILSALPFANLQTGGGSLLIVLLGFGVLGLFCYAFHGFGEAFKKRLVLLGVGAAVLVCAVFVRIHPPGLDVVHVMTGGGEIGYTVLRHRGDVVILKEQGGGEGDVLRYLDMYGNARAALVLTEPVVPADFGGLAGLAPRLAEVYAPGHAEGAAMSLMRNTLERAGLDERVVYLRHGDVRRSNGLEIAVREEPDGRMLAVVYFRGVEVPPPAPRG